MCQPLLGAHCAPVPRAMAGTSPALITQRVAMLNYNHLYYFHVAATEGSLSAAAAKLGVKQSTVSEQLRTLERTLNRTLFERTSGGMRLTSAGQIAYEHSSVVFRAGDRLLQALGEPAVQPPRSLRVGISNAVARTTSTDFLLPLFELPDCMPTITTGDAIDLLRDLRGNAFDLVLSERAGRAARRDRSHSAARHRTGRARSWPGLARRRAGAVSRELDVSLGGRALPRPARIQAAGRR